MTTKGRISKIGGVLALAAGFLILAGGVAAHSFLLSILGFFNANVSHYSPIFATEISEVAIDFLAVMISLGGITVILGGVAILYNRLFTGRLLIALGGGAGFLGLAITLAYSILTFGLPSILAHLEYWIGVILAVIARSLAKRK